MRRLESLPESALTRLEEIILKHTRLAKEHFTASPERQQEIRKKIDELVKERESILGG